MNIFRHKKLNKEKLIAYGFIWDEQKYTSIFPVLDGEFCLKIEIIPPGKIMTEMVEVASNEPYTLHLTNEAGTFVGKVRDEYERVLKDIEDKCFDKDIFKSRQAKKIIEYINETYSDELEYLWEKSPDCAIARRKDNKKWYLIIMVIKKDRLGIDSTDLAEVINLRAKVEDVPILHQKDGIYPGYHMNKKYWVTVLLDDSVPLAEIYKLLDNSYKLVKK